VIGGYDENYSQLSSIELFPLSDACSIPDLPQPRVDHSTSLLSPGGMLVVCGGSTGHPSSPVDSCVSFTAGDISWTHFSTMSQTRFGHTAWTPPSLPDSVVVIGGSHDTAETVPGKTSFELRHSGWQTCGISLGETIVLTGGGNEGHGHNYVTRYNLNGFVEELVRLPESRYGHACAALPSTGALVVAGGKDDGSQTWRSLSSVLSLSPEKDTAWTPLDPLPRPLASVRGSIVGDLDEWVFRVVGGYNDGSRNEVLEYRPSEGWIETGKLQTARYRHTVVSVGPQHFPCLGILV